MTHPAQPVDRAEVHGEDPTKPPALRFLAAVVGLQGLSGVGGGLGLVLDPSGDSLGIPLEWLRGSPFPDYLIPGLILFAFLGLGPLVVAYGIWAEQRWAWAGSVLVAASLLVWLAVEIAVIGYQPEPPLQLLYGIVALAILAGASAPSVRTRLRGRGTR